MNLKKMYLGLFFVFGLFFLGSIKVEAATYKYCEYTLPKGTAVDSKGLFGTRKTVQLEKDSTLMFLYKNKELVAVSFKGDNARINMLKDVNMKDALEDEQKSGILNYIKDGNCPDNLTSRGVWIEAGYRVFITDKYYSGSYNYEKVDEETYSNLPNLECKYKHHTIGDRTEIPSYINNDSILVYNSIRINLSLDNIITPSVSVINSFTSGKSPADKKLIDVLTEPIEFKDDHPVQDKGLGVTDYLYLFSALKTKECPSWLIYNPHDGYYLSKQEITTKGVPNLKGVDNDYSIYQIDYSEVCEEKLTSYEKELSDAESELNKISAELDEHIKNKTFTQELKNSYMSRMKELEKIETTLSNENINQYFDSEGICANSYDERVESINARKAKIKDQLTSDVLGSKISQANQASTILNAEQKAKNEKEFLDLQNYFQNLLTSISLDNFNQEQSCDTIFGDFNDPNTLGGMIQTIFNMVKIIAPILVIVLGAFDFGKAVIVSDQDALKKAQSSFIKRLLAAAALFFLPTLINLLLEMINTGMDPTCGIK